MIAFLRGYVATVSDGAAVIDVGGVGYEVRAAGETVQRLAAAGRDEEGKVYTYTYLREALRSCQWERQMTCGSRS